MSTHGAIAIGTPDDWRGRYLHLGGDMEDVVNVLGDMVERDGLEAAGRVLTDENYGWSHLSSSPDVALDKRHDARFRAVPGYGIVYTTHNNQSSPDEWITPDSADDADVTWIYLLQADGIRAWMVDEPHEIHVLSFGYTVGGVE